MKEGMVAFKAGTGQDWERNEAACSPNLRSLTGCLEDGRVEVHIPRCRDDRKTGIGRIRTDRGVEFSTFKALFKPEQRFRCHI